jgi:hypothetical protein
MQATAAAAIANKDGIRMRQDHSLVQRLVSWRSRDKRARIHSAA